MMKKQFINFAIIAICFIFSGWAQDQSVIEQIVSEANENSQLEILGQELMDGIGPRLVGTPQMKQAHDWAVDKYSQWGVSARNESYGTWRGWERGITHIDMLSPRIQSLKGTQLAWNPSTSKKGVTAAVIVLPTVSSPEEFQNWLPLVKGKLVMISPLETTGRPDYNWEEFATEASFEKMKSEREAANNAWRENMKNTGFTSRSIIEALENAGAAGIVSSYWSKGFGVSKIFSARTKKIPTVDLELEDYSMVYRLALRGENPVLNIVAQSKDLGEVPTFNTIAEIRGSEKPEEYVTTYSYRPQPPFRTSRSRRRQEQAKAWRK